MKNITLEVSLKPFLQIDDDYLESVCRKIFDQWKPLIRDAERVSVLLWTSDGSELLDYDGKEETSFEWAYWVGNANATPATHRSRSDPQGVGLHADPWRYVEHPIKMTYGILKRIVSTLKRVGRECLGDRAVLVGSTFDPGPEFAKSDFKYRRHTEVCHGSDIGVKSFVCAYATLKGDTRPYAGYPQGIPDGLPFGSFLGRQANLFLRDMGFDYLWLSNGMGFGRDAWSATGAIFDGKSFFAERLPKVKLAVYDFWRLFREECPDYPVQTRGTNMTMGIDLASDGVPLDAIYKGNFDLLPPPNSPWAAINGDFGLEIAGYLSRIAGIPGDDYLFRYYLHDPWWVNSPWYDRYNGLPHDIYLPMAVARIDERGRVCPPSHLGLLSIDNTYGELNDDCASEVIPHLRKGIKEAPDAPPVAVWVYPFSEYSACMDSERAMEIFSEDWYIRSCINNGMPLSAVTSTDAFLRQDPSIYAASILVTPVPDGGSEFEKSILQYVQNGGRVIFYGSARRASEEFCNLIGVRLGQGKEGRLPLMLDGKPAGQILHTPLIGGGPLREEPTGESRALATAADRAIMTRGEGFVWLRGVTSHEYAAEKRLPMPLDGGEYFNADALMRHALGELGYSILFESPAGQGCPVLTVHRHDNAYVFSQYSVSTTVRTKLRFPLGAPILDAYEAVLEDGYATYHFPKSERRECRVFVEQESGVVSCREYPPASATMRRRIRISGLKNATVRVLGEDYCKERLEILLNSTSLCIISEPVTWHYVTQDGNTYCEIPNVTGTLTVSMPMREEKRFYRE